MKAYNDIKKGIISNVYLFYGEEKYKFKLYKNLLKECVPYQNAMNFAYFEGKDIDFQAVYDNAVTLPFFAEKRLVIVENSGKFKAKKKDAEKDDKTDETDQSDQVIEKLLTDLPETTCLAFFEESVLKTRKIYKNIASKGVVEECAPDTSAELVKWAKKGFRSYGIDADPEALNFLVDRIGNNYSALLHEIEKLSSYADETKHISTSDVLDLASNNIESKIFDILGFMCNKNLNGVMEKYYDLLANKDDPHMIMAMIRRQFRIMLLVSELSGKGADEKTLCAATGSKPFVIKKMGGYLRFFNKNDIISVLDEINEIDMKTKTGDLNDRTAVELLLIHTCSR